VAIRLGFATHSSVFILLYCIGWCSNPANGCYTK